MVGMETGSGSCQDELDKRIKDEGRKPSTLRSPLRGMKRESQLEIQEERSEKREGAL